MSVSKNEILGIVIEKYMGDNTIFICKIKKHFASCCRNKRNA